MDVSTFIGNSYQGWKLGDKILISSQTGSGKTFFILHTLLPYAVDVKNTRIYYFVNRRILQKQLQEEIKNKFPQYQKYITIETYQSYEQKCRKSDDNDFEGCYIVMDEAHYFLADYSFNTATTKSFYSILKNRKAISVFMTATPEYLILLTMPLQQIYYVPFLTDPDYYSIHRRLNISSLLLEKEWGEKSDTEYKAEKIIEKKLSSLNFCDLGIINGFLWNLGFQYRQSSVQEFSDNFLNKSIHEQHKLLRDESFWNNLLQKAWSRDAEQYLIDYKNAYFCRLINYYRNRFDRISGDMEESYERMIRYEMPVNYDYIIPHYFSKEDDLLSLITDSGKEKWLWFVRSKNIGAQYVYQLSGENIDAVLITKDSRKKPKFSAERLAVDSVETQSLFTQKVLFATSTLDNGINIKDELVKHIVIDEFNHTEFIQKLGRIRVKKPTEIHLYIKSRSVIDVVNHFRQPNSVIDLLQFMADFTYMKNTYTKHSQLRESRYFQDNKFNKPYCKHLEQSYGSHIREVSGNNHELFCNDIKEFSKLLYSYEYYKLMAWLEELFENGQIDNDMTALTEEYHWIKKQLSWIGKEYDENQWVNSEEHTLLRHLLITKLELFSAGRYMTADEQANFKETFLKYAASCHIPDPAANSKASVETINSAFKRWNIPYQVISDRQRIDGIRARYWRIVPLSETTILPMIGFNQTKK